MHCIAAAGQPVNPDVDPVKLSASASSLVDAFRGIAKNKNDPWTVTIEQDAIRAKPCIQAGLLMGH